MGLILASWWNTDRVSAIAGSVGALAAVIAIVISVISFRRSKKAAEESRSLADSAFSIAEAAKREAATAVDHLSETRKQVDQQREELENSIRPLVVDAPIRASEWPFPGGGTGITLKELSEGGRHNLFSQTGDPVGVTRLVLEVRNIGNGVAFIHEVSLDVNPPSPDASLPSIFDGAPLPAVLDRKVIAPREAARVELVAADFEIAKSAPLKKAVQGDYAVLQIFYTDMPGGQRLLSRLSIRLDPDRDVSGLPGQSVSAGILRVSQVELFRCDAHWAPELQPFAATSHPQIVDAGAPDR